MWCWLETVCTEKLDFKDYFPSEGLWEGTRKVKKAWAAEIRVTIKKFREGSGAGEGVLLMDFVLLESPWSHP